MLVFVTSRWPDSVVKMVRASTGRTKKAWKSESLKLEAQNFFSKRNGAQQSFSVFTLKFFFFFVVLVSMDNWNQILELSTCTSVVVGGLFPKNPLEIL